MDMHDTPFEEFGTVSNASKMEKAKPASRPGTNLRELTTGRVEMKAACARTVGDVELLLVKTGAPASKVYEDVPDGQGR